MTKILCGECGGQYLSHEVPTIGFYECVQCGHEVTSFDLVLDEGETETVDAEGWLYYTTEEVSA